MRRRLTLRQIEAFRAVMLNGSISGGAGLLGLTQPAVSRLIRDLEDTVDLPLFGRRGNQVVANPEAMLLYREVERSFAGLGRIEQAARDIRNAWRGSIRVSGMAGPMLRHVPKLVAAFIGAHPGTTFSLRNNVSAATLEAVSLRQADMGIVYSPIDEPGLDVERLEGLEAVCVVPATHPLAGAAQVHVDDLRDAPLLSLGPDSGLWSQLDATLRSRGIMPRVVMEATSSEALCVLAGLGLGVALVDPFTTAHHREAGVVTRRFVPRLAYDIALVYPAQTRRSRMLQEFSTLFRASAQMELLAQCDVLPPPAG